MSVTTVHRHVYAALLICAAFVLPAAASAQGMLLPSDDSLAALELRSHRVDFEVADHAAVTHVTQVFANHTSQDLEATYYFAVPEGATTTDFALWMNGERIRGEVLPRAEARATYESIVRRMRDPGLLEYIDGELFQASIYPVPAHGEQTVEIEFATVLPQDGTMIRYTYPLHASAGATVRELIIDGTVTSRGEIATLYSPHHAIEEIRTDGGRSRRVTAEVRNASASEDFELFIGQAEEDVGFSLLTHDADDGEDGYFMLTLTPSADLDDLEVLPKHVTFVVDTSGSMAGQKMEQAQDMLRSCIEALNRDDTFNVIGFSTTVRPAFESPAPADRDHRREALAFVDALRARGNTNISEALDRALDDDVDDDRPHVVVFVTDGLPTEGETSVERIVDAVATGVSDGDRRVFAFGVGYDVNTRLLDGVARRGRGESGYVEPQQDISDVVGAFFSQVQSPLLTQIELDFGAVNVGQLYPRPLPDLYRDGQITVFGRFDARSNSPVVIRGRAGSERVTLEFEPDWSGADGTDKSFIANLWARRRVDDLLWEIEEQGETSRRVSEVTELASRWNIVTPYTSYLAIEPSMRNEFGMPRASRDADDSEDEAFNSLGEAPAPMGGNIYGQAQAQAEYEPFADRAREEAGVAGLDDLTTGSGRTGGARSSSSTRAPQAAAAAPMEETGELAVQQALERQRQRNDTTVTTPSASRSAAGRSFSAMNGVWVESGLESTTPDRTISYFSDEYFSLLRDHPELGDVLALGERVRFRVGREVIEVR